MTGSIRARPDRGRGAWELRIYLGRDGNGRVRHRSRLFRGTKRAAQRELARLVAEQDRKPAVVPDEPARAWGPTTTVNDAIQGWAENGWDDLSPSTVRRYRSLWKVHIQDSIGTKKVASLGSYDVERYFRQLKGKGLSEATVRQVRAVLHRSCRLARKWSGGTLPNPISETELPDWSLAEAGDEVRAPTPEEIRALLAATGEGDRRLATLVRVVAATGMRRGEACALRWSDVDWETASIRVDEALVAEVGGTSARGPKTRASIRVVAVDTGTLDRLRDLRVHQEELAVASGLELKPDGFLFSARPGGESPPHPDRISHAFAGLRARAGVPADVHLHSLRHFQSTQLDRVITEAQKQARLGWSTVHMARHYTGAVDTEDRRAADHIGGLLG